MQQVISATLYLVVLLRGAFFGGNWYPAGQSLQVSRDERNTMVANDSARDANDEEIAAFRGDIAAGEGASDETSASLSAATAKLEALEGQRTAAQAALDGLLKQRDEMVSEVEGLIEQRKGLVDEVNELTTTQGKLSADIETLGGQKATLEIEITALVADKAAKAVKAAK